MTCYIVGAGDLEGAEFLRPQKDDLLIAADGGLDHLRAAGLEPDILLGDFDSLRASAPGDDCRCEVIGFPPEKDYTDMMLAAETGYARGCRSFHLFGGTGGRMGHTLANIQTVVNLTKRGCQARLYGKDYVILALHNGTARFSDRHRGYFSVYAYSDTASGVRERGFRYEIENFTLSSDDPRGISNEFCGREGEITVENGTLLICVESFHGF